MTTVQGVLVARATTLLFAEAQPQVQPVAVAELRPTWLVVCSCGWSREVPA